MVWPGPASLSSPSITSMLHEDSGTEVNCKFKQTDTAVVAQTVMVSVAKDTMLMLASA